MDWLVFVRALHVLAASCWLGEVLVINLILVPTLSSYTGAARRDFLATVFPRVFHLASVLAGTVAVTGALLLYRFTAGDWRVLTDGRWGLCILIGGSLGGLLIGFHFFMEDRLARRVGIGRPDVGQDVVEDVHVKLKIVPRVGLAVITTIYVLMLFAVRGV
jgi:uncharacterized membrane protein